jgi:hypothetical protein
VAVVWSTAVLRSSSASRACVAQHQDRSSGQVSMTACSSREQMGVAQRVGGWGIGVIRCSGVVHGGCGATREHPGLNPWRPCRVVDARSAANIAGVEAECSQASRPSMRNPVWSTWASAAWAIRVRMRSTNSPNASAARVVTAATVPWLIGVVNSSVRAWAVRFGGQKLTDIQGDDQRCGPRPVVHRRSPPRPVRRAGLASHTGIAWPPTGAR